MLQLASSLRIFLSSTYVDLHPIREEVAARLSEVFGAQLIAMESFGSDDTPPDITSVRRVAEADIFVGIYARRYGTIELATGKSITELELDEAERAFSAGTLSAILLYMLDEDTPWPQGDADTDPVAREGLRRLKDRARRYTVARFKRGQDLPFFVIRDVLAKLRDRLSVASLRLRRWELPPDERLTKPIGMEFLKSTDRRYLVGRNDAIDEVFKSLEQEPITLLLGSSGVGKTSLIHAGLLPRALYNGWVLVYTRPLGLPRSDVVSKLEATIFEGRPLYRGPLLPLLGQVVVALDGRRLLLVIDQFEDVLVARELSETLDLVSDLQGIQLLAEPACRVLISYRADLEGRLGHYWQQISGDPAGLPRAYVRGISGDEAWRGVVDAARDLGLSISLTSEEEARIKQDLIAASRAIGETDVYPPYVQMLIDHMWRTHHEGADAYRSVEYKAARGMEGIIGGYLTRQLAYAQDKEGHLKLVLIALVRSYGTKAHRTLAEVAAEVGLSEDRCEQLLERLIDFRLVRHIDEYYEIAHDFLAREISTKLVDAAELEFKRFRELLASKAAAFATTGALLTPKEVLLLFKYKERVLPTEAELRLLLASWLREPVPGLFWLVSGHAGLLEGWVRAEEASEGLNREQSAAAALLRRKLTGKPLDENEWKAFRDYQLASELVALLKSDPLDCPPRALLFALRSRHRHVRDAALLAVARRVSQGEWSWIPRLRNSSSARLREAYERLVTEPDVGLPPKDLGKSAGGGIQEFAALKNLTKATEPREARKSLAALKRTRPKARSLLIGEGLAARVSRGVASVLSRAERSDENGAVALIGTLGTRLGKKCFRQLLDAYRRWNRIEARHLQRVADAASAEGSRLERESMSNRKKCEALAEAIMRSALPSHVSALRRAFRTFVLTPSSQAVIMAFAHHGSPKDLEAICRRIAEAGYPIRYWHQIEVSRVMGNRMAETAEGSPNDLRALIERKAFWKHPREEKMAKSDLLPLAEPENRTLFIRIVAHTVIGAAQRGDSDLLCRLATHPFRMVARWAALRLIAVAGVEGMARLQSLLSETIETDDARWLAVAIRDAEIQHYGVAQFW